MKLLTISIVTLLFSFGASATSIFSGEEIFKAPHYSVPQLNPNGKFVVGRVNDGSKRELVITELSSGQQYPLVFFAKGNYLEEFYWIDNDSLYIEYRSGKEQRKSILNIVPNDLATKQPTQRVKASGHLLSALPAKQDTVLFLRENGSESPTIYEIHTDTLLAQGFGAAKPFSNPLENAKGYVFDEKNHAFFGFTLNDDEDAFTLWFLANENSQWRELYTSNDVSHEFRALEYIGDEKFLILSNENTDRVSLAVFNLVTQKIEKVLYEKPQFDIVDAEYDTENQQLISVTYLEHGTPQIEYFRDDAQDYHQFVLESEDDDPVYEVSYSLDGTKKVLFAYGAAHPGTYIYADEKNKNTKLIAHRYPNLVEHEFAKTRKISVTTDDVTQDAYLTLPYLGGNGVLLVIPQIISDQNNNLTEFSKSVQFFANRGFTVLRVNVDSPFDFGEQPNDSISINVDETIEKRIHAAVSEVKIQQDISKTCSVGGSYTGYNAVRLPLLYPEHYDCVISMFGIYDFQLLFSGDNAGGLNLSRQFVKDTFNNQGDSVVEQSPVFLAKNLNIPVMLIAGEKDDIAIPEQTNRLKYVLSKQTDSLETLIYRDVGHGVKNWYGEQQLHAIADDFLRRHLQLPKLETIADPVEAAKEYVKVADVFDFDTLVENEKPKAFEYYVKAARLGHPRAMFNYGAYFHRGEFVDQSMEDALLWYKKAAEAGYASASYRLGNLYQGISGIDEDLALAHKYYLMAHDQGYDARAGIKIAEQLCTGKIVEKNLKQCLALLDLKQIKKDNLKNREKKVTKASTKMLFSILPKLMLDNDNLDVQNSFYKRLVREEFDIRNVNESISEVRIGYRPKNSDFEVIRDNEHVPAISGSQIGFHLTPASAHEDGKIGLLTRTTLIYANGESKVIHHNLYHKGNNTDWKIYYTLDEIDLEASAIKFEIMNINREPLVDHTFQLQFQ